MERPWRPVSELGLLKMRLVLGFLLLAALKPNPRIDSLSFISCTVSTRRCASKCILIQNKLEVCTYSAVMFHQAPKQSELLNHTCLPPCLSFAAAAPVFRQRACRGLCRQQLKVEHHLVERRCRAAHIMCSASQTDTAARAALPPLKPLTGVHTSMGKYWDWRSDS